MWATACATLLTLVPLSRYWRGFLLLFFMLAMGSAGLAAEPDAWPQWSRPEEVARGNRLFGFQSTLLPDGRVVAAVVSENTESILIYGLGDGNTRLIAVKNLSSFAVCTMGQEVAVVWSERSDLHSALWLQVGSGPKTQILHGPYFIQEVTLKSGPFGVLYVAWAGGSIGQEEIFLTEIDIATWAAPKTVQVTDSASLNRSPRLEIYASTAHLIFFRDQVLYSEALYHRVNLDTWAISEEVRIGDTSRESSNAPALLPQEDGAAAVFWLRSTMVRGQIMQSALVSGQLTAAGEWAVPLTPINEQGGSNLGLSLTKTNAKETLLVWLNNTKGSFQAHYLTLSRDGQVLESGPVTRGAGNKFGAQVHASDIWYVLYYELVGDGLKVMQVDNLNIAPVPLAVRFGLDPDFVVLDALYTLVSTLFGALALTLLAALGIIPMLLLLGLVPHVQPAHYLALVVLCNIALRFVAPLYLDNVLLPGLAGFMASLLCAGLSYAVLLRYKLAASDIFALGLFGFFYIFLVFFCSMLIRGAWTLSEAYAMHHIFLDLVLACFSFALYARHSKGPHAIG